MARNPDDILILDGEVVSMRQLIEDAMTAEEFFSADDLEAYAAEQADSEVQGEC